MNAFIVVDNFRNSFADVSHKNLTESLLLSYKTYAQCCEREDFDFNNKSKSFQKFAKLHDLMATHYGYWGYLEHEEVLIELGKKLKELCKLPKKDIVQFYVSELERQFGASADIALMEARGATVIRIDDNI